MLKTRPVTKTVLQLTVGLMLGLLTVSFAKQGTESLFRPSIRTVEMGTSKVKPCDENAEIVMTTRVPLICVNGAWKPTKVGFKYH